MSIKRTIITTIAVLALVAVVAPGVAQGVTIDELMAQIAQLQSQLVTLGGNTPTPTAGTGACAGVTFSRNLTTGAIGADVKCLQSILNQSATTQVSATGAGAPGMETTTFGPKTLVAVKKFQAANGMTPANQVGPMTRAKLNTMLGGGTVIVNPPVVTPTGPVSAMVAVSSPSAGAIVSSQAAANLLEVNFTGSGTVTSVTLNRSGISDQNTLTNVYLYDGNVRITDGYSFNVGGTIVMNGLNIAVSGSKVISVRADIAATAVVGSAGTSPASNIAVGLTSYTAGGTATASTVRGNSMSIVIGSLATASLSANTVTGSPSVNAGVTQYTFWSAPIQVNTRAVLLKTASFKMIGSAPSDALANIKMFIDGIDTSKVATVTSVNGSNYAMFDIASAPYTLTTGSHTIDIRADVQKGTNRTVQLVLQQAADLTITDPQVGVNIAVASTNIPNGVTNSVTILSGSVTVVVDPTFTTNTNISGGATNAVLARFKIHAYGEDVKVQTIDVVPAIYGALATVVGGTNCTTNGTTGAIATGVCGLNNVTLYFNGSQVGSQINYAAATYTMGTSDAVGGTIGTAIVFQLGSQVIAPAGQDSILEVRGDLQTTGNYAYSAGTVKVGLPALTTNGIGQSSQASIAVPTAAVTTTGLTISAGGLKVAANTGFLSQSISPNSTGVKIGSYTVQNQSTSQSIRLTSLSIATTTTTATINNFSALRTSNTTGSGATPTQLSGTGSGFTSTDVFSINDTLAPGAIQVIEIFANTGATATGTIATTLNVSSIGTIDNIATTSGAKTGQTLTLGTGTVNASPTLVVSSTTPAQYVAAAGGVANVAQATFNLVSTSGASTITELKFAVSGSDASSSSNTVTNVCVGTVCAAPVAGIASLTGLNLVVPNGGSGLMVNAQVSLSSVGTGGITPAVLTRIALSSVKYTTGSSTKTLCSTVQAGLDGITCDATFVGTNAAPESTNMATVGVASPYLVMVGSKPTITVSTGGGAGLQLGQSNKIGEFTVAADAKGAIKLRAVTFSIGNSGFGAGTPMTIASSGTTPFLAIGSTAIVGSSCNVTVAYSTIVCTLGSSTYATDFPISAGQSQLFSLYATVNGTAATSATPAVSSSLTAAGFTWDDTSDNGGSTALGLTGTSIYGFPTNAYSYHQ